MTWDAVFRRLHYLASISSDPDIDWPSKETIDLAIEYSKRQMWEESPAPDAVVPSVSGEVIFYFGDKQIMFEAQRCHKVKENHQ